MKKRSLKLLIILLICIAGLLIVSLLVGKLALSGKDLLEVLSGNMSRRNELLLFEFRLPRIFVALLAGACLALSGLILQTVLRNPLADPGILGINAGAGIGVMFYLLFLTGNTNLYYLLPLCALAGAILSVILTIAFSYSKMNGLVPIRLILTGVAIGAGMNAVNILLTTKVDSEKYRFLVTWLAGSIWGDNWNFVLILFLTILVIFPLALFKSKVLDILMLGEDQAILLGINASRERNLLLLFAVILAGIGVSATGGIGFLGLIAPHMIKQADFSKHRQLLPLVALLGGFLLLGADTIGRVVLQSGELPAGTIIAVLGAPYFLWMLLHPLKAQ